MKLANCGVLAILFAMVFCAPVRSAPMWTEGVNYFLVDPARPTSLPHGKVEVTEVFSYACPACNLFVPTMRKLKQSLPPNAVLDFVPASFNPSEDWPMFQLAYCTAQILGVADQTHDAMFNAVWQTGELAVARGSEPAKDEVTGLLAAEGPGVLLEREQHVVARAVSDEIDLPAWARVSANAQLVFARELDLHVGSDPVSVVPKQIGR